MTNAMLDLDAREPRVAPRAGSKLRALAGSLLVVGHDDDTLSGPLFVAQELARRDRLRAHVLTLVQPLSYIAPILTKADAAALGEGRRQAQLARVRRRVHRTVGRSAHFSISAELGSPTRSVARAVRRRRAAMVLVGIGVRGAPERAKTEDAALQLARTAGVPVLAVPADGALLPRRALVALNFDGASVRAARATLLVLASGGSLTLAHVAEPGLDCEEAGPEGWGDIYADGVAGLFRRIEPELSALGDVDVQTVTVHGDPFTSLPELASRGDFDLLAAGSPRSTPWPDTNPLGSVSAALLRGADCTVLIAPPPAGRR